jgi:hypothetical protein
LASKVCPHCGQSIGERWHQRYGVQKLERGSGEVGVPVIGSVMLRKETLVMVYVCELTNLPFLVVMEKAKDTQ